MCGRAARIRSAAKWRGTRPGRRKSTRGPNIFGYDDKAEVSLNSILGYMPTVPNWGYNGNARRYWDFYYGAAPGGQLERQIHHYGSGINAIPSSPRIANARMIFICCASVTAGRWVRCRTSTRMASPRRRFIPSP